MLIRTQDKGIIVNLDNVDEIYADPMCRIVAIFGNQKARVLGEYSPDNIRKVMDQIMERYKWKYGDISLKIFDMPLNSEVKDG